MFSWEAFITTAKPIAVFTFGITIYALFVFYFYKFLARRDTFKLDLQRYNTAKHPLLKKMFHFIFYVIEYILLFPLVASFWFGALTVLLLILSKDPLIKSVLLVSVSVVGAVRITAYISEDLSRDLAKMLPFALLGIYLVDASYLNVAELIVLLKLLPSEFVQVFYSFLFLLGLEIFMRIAGVATLPFQKES